jgi:hypothetical protein
MEVKGQKVKLSIWVCGVQSPPHSPPNELIFVT